MDLIEIGVELIETGREFTEKCSESISLLLEGYKPVIMFKPLWMFAFFHLFNDEIEVYTTKSGQDWYRFKRQHHA